MPCRFAVLHIILLIMLGAASQAQVIQIPVDDDARLQRITPELEEELQLFPEYPGFVDARLFRVSDSLYQLEIEYTESGETRKSQVSMNAAEMRAFRERISRRLREKAPQALVDREGRAAFLTGTTVLSLGFYGWSIPSMLGVESGSTFTGSVLLIGGAGFLIPYLATEESRVTDGMASLSIQGGIRGIFDGMLLYWMLGGNGEKGLLATATGMSLGELITGYVVADNTNLSGGSAGTIGVLGNFGLGIGLGSYVLVADDNFKNNRVAPLMGLGFSAAGYAIGTAMSNSRHYTAGDATILANLGMLGAIVPPSLLSVTDSEDENLYIGAAIAGSIGGLVLGHSLLAERDFTSSQGSYVSLGTLAGGLMGLGVVFLTNTDSGKAYAIAGSAGATLGFALMYGGYADQAAAASKSLSLDVQVNPVGLFGSVSNATWYRDYPLPFVTLQARW